MTQDAQEGAVMDPEQRVLETLLADTPARPDLLLPLLQEIQRQLGWISAEAMERVAEALNLSRADVYGVVSFYRDLRLAPVGRAVVQLCMGEACQAVGSRTLAAHASQALGVSINSSTPDGRFHLEECFCFGNCALGPAIRITTPKHEAVYGLVSPDRLDSLLADPAVIS